MESGTINNALGDYAPGASRRAEPSRLAELLVLLADQLVQIDQTVAAHFPRRLLAGAQGGGERDELKCITPELIREYLSMSDGDPGCERLRQDIERRLIGLAYQVWAVTKSMESLPLRYAKTRSPAAIEDAPGISAGGGLFRSNAKYRKYWEKYTELCGGRDPDTLVKSMTDLHEQILVGILQARGGPARGA